MRADANAAAIAARDFVHGLLLPRGTAAAASALIYQSRSSRVAIQPRQLLHIGVCADGHNPRIIGDRDLRDGWLVRTPIAHRGLHAAFEGRPENSLAAFAHCCALGFPAELDVRLSRDGEVVVFHDRALQRLTGAAGRVEERDAAELRALRLLGTRERVPLLRDVLDLVGGRAALVIEVEAGAAPSALGGAGRCGSGGGPARRRPPWSGRPSPLWTAARARSRSSRSGSAPSASSTAPR